MQKLALNPQQSRNLGIFHLLLEHYGWEDLHETESRMDAGESLSPEGSRTLRRRSLSLQARFHAPVNMISLLIAEQNQPGRVQIHFFFQNQPERILEWIGQAGASLDLETYPEWLQRSGGICDTILLEVSDTEIYEVKPSARPGLPLQS
jgi:hypothetical protein